MIGSVRSNELQILTLLAYNAFVGNAWSGLMICVQESVASKRVSEQSLDESSTTLGLREAGPGLVLGDPGRGQCLSGYSLFVLGPPAVTCGIH